MDSRTPVFHQLRVAFQGRKSGCFAHVPKCSNAHGWTFKERSRDIQAYRQVPSTHTGQSSQLPNDACGGLRGSKVRLEKTLIGIQVQSDPYLVTVTTSQDPTRTDTDAWLGVWALSTAHGTQPGPACITESSVLPPRPKVSGYDQKQAPTRSPELLSPMLEFCSPKWKQQNMYWAPTVRVQKWEVDKQLSLHMLPLFS